MFEPEVFRAEHTVSTMASTSHDHETPTPVTDRLHETSWSANLEKPQHADDRSLVVDQALQAINHTASGHHVNLVTHGDHGHPADYLYPAIEEAGLDREIEWEYIERCGCGGHVTRVHVT